MNSHTNRKIRALITGSSGMLGKDLFFEFEKRGFFVIGVDKEVHPEIPQDLQEIGDLSDEEFTKSVLQKIRPHLIIHCAAIVNLTLCEENKELANKLHTEVTKWLAQYNTNKTKIIYISTDSVFDGKKGNYQENDIPNPLNYYAQSKLSGERSAMLNPNHIVIRTNIFGFNLPLRNSLAEWAIKNLENNVQIKGFDDVYFNAIYTKQLGDIIYQLVKKEFTGLINLASKKFISKFEFLSYLAKKLGYSERLVNKSLIENAIFEIARPLNTTLSVEKASRILKLPTIFEGIDQLVINYKSQLS